MEIPDERVAGNEERAVLHVNEIREGEIISRKWNGGRYEGRSMK